MKRTRDSEPQKESSEVFSSGESVRKSEENSNVTVVANRAGSPKDAVRAVDVCSHPFEFDLQCRTFGKTELRPGERSEEVLRFVELEQLVCAGVEQCRMPKKIACIDAYHGKEAHIVESFEIGEKKELCLRCQFGPSIALTRKPRRYADIESRVFQQGGGGVGVSGEREIFSVAVNEAEVEIWGRDSHSAERDERSAERHGCLCGSLVDDPHRLCNAANDEKQSRK